MFIIKEELTMKLRKFIGTSMLVVSVLGLCLSGIWGYQYRQNNPQLTDAECMLNNKQSMYCTIISTVLLMIGLGTKNYRAKKTKK